MDQVVRAAVWKRGVATALDFFTAFAGFGYAIATFTGNATPGGFNLTGAPAFVLFGLVAAYFIIGRKFAGGTPWDRVFGIARPQPE